MKGELDGDNGSLSFVPAFVHEEDAVTDVLCSSQPSFQGLQAGIDEFGEDVAENPYIQAMPKTIWQAMYGRPLSYGTTDLLWT